MTKPYLYIDGEQGRSNVLYYPGDGPVIADSGPVNLLPLNIATTVSVAGWSVGGTDMSSLGLLDTPARADTGTIADDVINKSVFGVEWTGTTSSEQLVTYNRNVQINQGDSIGAGAWVYLDATGSRNIRVQIVFFDTSGSVSESSGSGTNTVEPNTWTWVKRDNVTVNQAGSVFASLYIQQDGGQSVGDKLYVGAASLGYDVTAWHYPFQSATTVMDFRFSAKILSDGTLFSSRDVTGNGGEGMHIEAVNQGFHVRNRSVSVSNIPTDVTYTTATNIYEYGVWYDFKWTYEKNTGDQAFYILDEGRWVEIDSGTVAVGSTVYSSYHGINTLSTGLTTSDPTHALIDSFGFFYEDDGWVAQGFEEDSLLWTGDILGSELVVYSDGSTANYNEAFYAPKSGWIINADSVNKGALELPYRSELKFGTGDFTIVQNFTAVGSHAGTPVLYDDFGSTAGVKLWENSGFKFVAGATQVTHTTIFDGTPRFLMAERESGVELRLYVDDADTPVNTAVDPGADLNNTVALNLGSDGIADTDSVLSCLLGVTIIFNRLLHYGEKRDLEGWIEAGYPADEGEPDWLRTEAVLYLNPNDPVQQAEYTARDRLINLALDVPDEVWVRYDFTTVDGVSNPVLTHNEVSFSNPTIYPQAQFNAYDNGKSPFYELGHGASPLLAKSGEIVIPLEELGPDWVNNDFTVNFWLKTIDDGVALDMLYHGGGSEFSIRDRTDESISVTINSTLILASAASPTPLKEYSMLTVRRSGNNFEMFINAVSEDTATSSATATLTSDLVYRPSNNGMVGPLQIWERALSDGEIGSLYNGSPLAEYDIAMGTTTLTDSFASVSRVWERI